MTHLDCPSSSYATVAATAAVRYVSDISSSPTVLVVLKRGRDHPLYPLARPLFVDIIIHRNFINSRLLLAGFYSPG